ncbi:MAG: hypothetical protein ABJN72_07580 [Sulfitobacter sp.]
MKPVLRSAIAGERKISDVVEELGKAFDLKIDERAELTRVRKKHVGDTLFNAAVPLQSFYE